MVSNARVKIISMPILEVYVRLVCHRYKLEGPIIVGDIQAHWTFSTNHVGIQSLAWGTKATVS